MMRAATLFVRDSQNRVATSASQEARRGAMFIRKKPAKAEPREIPQWKLDMMAEASSSTAAASSSSAKRPREDDPPPAKPPPPPPAVERDEPKEKKSEPDLPPEDDDDDEDFDPRIYGGEDEDDDVPVPQALVARHAPLTVEQQLLMREARDSGRRNDGSVRTKTFYVEDQEASLVGSLGSEAKQARIAAGLQGRKPGMPTDYRGTDLPAFAPHGGDSREKKPPHWRK